ncbi:PREDICTED: uncharacterized protein ycf45 [Tarenaya hassleriana]|uniref:uncharacterized protein ycf45 n=1 Tax=Tarenaya hassleriana TaxID=28532 RepID=UPI00053C98F3|nr:PREDICTED: uncharacterized protein ycf45 [Tarenaya hassleriana]
MHCLSLNPPLSLFHHEQAFIKLRLRSCLLGTKLLLVSHSSSSPHGVVVSSSAAASAVVAAENGDGFGQELRRLLSLVPEKMRRKLEDHLEISELIEVVLDLGRNPLARFPSGDFVISDDAVRVQDLQFAVSQVGEFTNDNRAGISRTLHRISAIRNRKGEIVGLTCRVGRAVRGSANLLRDLVQDGNSLLLIGPPGVGKTTMIREVARMLANDYKKRVMIVDTSNEIGGDGDIPHPGIGDARRMQVPDSEMQHKVLIEAVENHMPQVIVIDEIGTKLEAMAASTIAERGIQLVATAHGATIENLVMNPSLDLLVGGVQNVTLGDEEATRRGGQKTVLERKGPPTFSCGVEIISKAEIRVHRSLEATVDTVLAGRSPNVEIRKINSQGEEVIVEKEPAIDMTLNKKHEMVTRDIPELISEATKSEFLSSEEITEAEVIKDEMPLYLYVYGVAESSVVHGIKQLEVETVVELTDDISEADALLALQSKLKKNPRIKSVATTHGIPVYLTKTSSVVQVTKALRALLTDYEDGLGEFGSEDGAKLSEKMDALEVRVTTTRDLVCKGSEMCLRILPYGTNDVIDEDEDEDDEDDEFDEFLGSTGDSDGSPFTIDRLPLLPD